ncbi:YaiO family outer membrane beta-barrel protein [Pseudomonas fakonensis]|uniref:YaiO family outer membrane beta-barrel protein n=1 Tax=Pseudomonas fakonensis TaxID=2842355 RepID=A0ABX8N653_9PSED|nr:YaiO family outer membrane beta-barrel protein [Pseudomonas fakonensis]QXH50793.1 YaiO family outer membrane beta-barrel protein [Pseudomonas fakonensis]
MKKVPRLTFVALLIGSASVQAADSWVTAELSHTHYSGDFGERDILWAEYGHRFGVNTVVLKAFGGSREYEKGASFNDAGLSGTFYRHWSDKLSTRTHLAFSKDDPVFATRQYDQEFSYKAFENTLVSVGAKHTKYAGGVESNAWYASTAYYFDRIMLRYRYTHSNLSGIDNSHGHLITVKLKDRQGAGSTQLWFGQGTSVHEYDWSPVVQKGDHKSIALNRVQPVTQSTTLNVGLAQEWFDTPTSDYKALTGKLGVTYRW